MESGIFFSRSYKARLAKALDSLSENLADEGCIAFKMDQSFFTEKKAVQELEVETGSPCEPFSQTLASSWSNTDELDHDFEQKEVPQNISRTFRKGIFKELRFLVGKAIEGLQEMERLVITLFYYEELTLKEIAKVLGVPESQASQIHTTAIIRLTNMLKRQGEPVYVN